MFLFSFAGDGVLHSHRDEYPGEDFVYDLLVVGATVVTRITTNIAQAVTVFVATAFLFLPIQFGGYRRPNVVESAITDAGTTDY